MADRQARLLEAERRGILPSDAQARLDEARRRGLVPQALPKPETTALGQFARGAADIAGFGFADEAEAGLRSAFGDRSFQEELVEARARQAQAGPAFRIGQVAGLFSPLGIAGRAIRGATTLGQAALRGAGAGAVEGAVAGFGGGEGTEGRLTGAGTGAVLGAPLGAAGGAVAQRLLRSRPVREGVEEARELGIPLTRGQTTGSVPQQAREERLRRIGEGPLAQLERQQQAVVGETVENIGEGLGDVGAVAPSLLHARQASRAAVNQAYDDVVRLAGRVDDRAVGAFRERLTQVIDDPSEGFGLNPEVGGFLEGVTERIFGRLTDQPTIQQIEGIRKGLNSVSRSTTDPARRAGVRRMIGEFDDWLVQTVDSAAYQGDEATLSALQNARGLNRAYQQAFGGRGGVKGSDIVAKMAEDGVDSREAVNFLFGAGRVLQKGQGPTRQAVQIIREQSPEAFEGIRAAAWERLTRNATGDLKSPQEIARSIQQNAFQSPGLMQEVFGDALPRINQLGRAIRATKTDAQALNPSGTAMTLLRSLNDALGLVPGVNVIPAIARAASAQRAVNVPTQVAPRLGGAAARLGRTAPAIQEELR